MCENDRHLAKDLHQSYAQIFNVSDNKIVLTFVSFTMHRIALSDFTITAPNIKIHRMYIVK